MDSGHHNLEDFNELGMDDQLRIVRKQANKEEFLETDISKIELYSYNNFFIEVIYRKELKILRSIKAIGILEYADKYIELEDMGDY